MTLKTLAAILLRRRAVCPRRAKPAPAPTVREYEDDDAVLDRLAAGNSDEVRMREGAAYLRAGIAWGPAAAE